MTWRPIPTFSRWSPPPPPCRLSGVPFMGPIGAARVGYIKGETVVNPTIDR